MSEPRVPVFDADLEKMRKQSVVTGVLSLVALAAYMLGLPFVMFLDGANAWLGVCACTTFLLVFAFIGVISKILYVVRGGTLTTGHLIILGLQIMIILPGMLVLYYCTLTVLQLP